jgi:hypothetical protein
VPRKQCGNREAAGRYRAGSFSNYREPRAYRLQYLGESETDFVPHACIYRALRREVATHSRRVQRLFLEQQMLAVQRLEQRNEPRRPNLWRLLQQATDLTQDQSGDGR